MCPLNRHVTKIWKRIKPVPFRSKDQTFSQPGKGKQVPIFFLQLQGRVGKTLSKKITSFSSKPAQINMEF